MLTGVKDLDMKMLNELEDIDLVNYCKTNKQASEMCDDQSFWAKRVMLKFPYVPSNVLIQNKGDRKWSEYYIKDLRNINSNVGLHYIMKGSENGRLDHVMIGKNKALTNDLSNIHITDTSGKTPLIYASIGGYVDVVKFLLQNGVNPNTATRYNQRAIDSVKNKSRLDITKLLIEYGADIFPKDGNIGPLLNASSLGDIKLIKFLLDNGIDINYQTKALSNALFFSKDAETAKFLLENGADPNQQNDIGLTVLMMAVNQGDYNKVKILLENGADPNAVSNSGKNVLSYVFSKSQENYNSIKTLLKQYL